MLTQMRLREVLHYNPETGIFTWTKGDRRGKRAGTEHDDRGYLKVSIDNKRYPLHRLAWLWMRGLHARSTVEHINGDHADNRWNNLRLGASGVKRTHCAPYPEPTQYRGVYQLGDRFEALVPVASEMLNIGSFATAEEAWDAINQAMKSALERQRQRVRSLR